MANSSDPARRRRSASDVLGLMRAATAPLGQSFVVSLMALGDNAQAAFVRLFDSGYDPGASEEHTRRGEEGISVRNLSVRYGDRYAIESLTGEFAPTSLTAVVGPNGAGKSSLLKALAGIIRPAAGEVTSAAVERHRLAYLPQQDELDRGFPITVAELVALGGWRNFGAVREPPRRLAASVDEALAAVGLSSVAHQPIAELSVGQFQRALFARLLLHDADVILLDEPFASLDENTTEDLLHFLQRWRTEGRTVVAVLHDLDQVRRYFPSTLLLARSPIAWGETSLSLSADNLARAKKAMNPPESARIGWVA
jgi:zinc/manganese transport system ATP-binding protein